jgi:hypothetical protein
MAKSAFLVLLSVLAYGYAALHKGQFHSEVWTFDNAQEVDPSSTVKFVVALKLNDVEGMRQQFLEVSNPKSSSYGRHLTSSQINARYGPSAEEKERVIDHFKKIEGAEVKIGQHGDMLQVVAQIGAIESVLNTKLAWVTDSRKLSDKKSIRSTMELEIPAEIDDLISFISLNSPVNHVLPRGAAALKQRQAVDKARETEEEAAASVSITAGNEEALIRFTPNCNGAINTLSPPCYDLPADQLPTYTFSVTTHANNKTDSFLLDTDPVNFVVKNNAVYCYNSYTAQTCGGFDGKNCTCLTKVSLFHTLSIYNTKYAFFFSCLLCPSTPSCA